MPPISPTLINWLVFEAFQQRIVKFSTTDLPPAVPKYLTHPNGAL